MRVLAVMLVVLGTAGCSGTPNSVKAQSTAQSEGMNAYCAGLERTVETLKKYFGRYAAEKEQVFAQRHEQNKRDTLALVRSRAEKDGWDAARTAAEVATKFSELENQLAQDKADLRARVLALHSALDTQVAQCKTLNRAQDKLDEYVQVEKTNDVINQLLADTLGEDGKALTKQLDELAEQIPKL